jgi:cyclomaltodextrinase / maltogenic alpha-amylase / neopullulanase
LLPAWVPGRTIYHLHSLAAAGAGGIGRLQGWLDHVAGLGCGAVLLTPVHHSTSHGYDTIDPFRLDPRLGTDADFEAFAAACAVRDLRLVLDGVFNHVGREFPRDDWLSGRSWEGHDELRELDHGNPEVLQWAVDACRHWLDRGASGWRFDVAYAISRPFLREVVRQVTASHPDALLFGEMIHGDYDRLVSSTGLHSATQYELYKAIWSSLNDANLFELAWALERHRSFAATFPPVTFVGNHDVTRIASALHDPAHLELALAVVFTVPGIPCVYYGDELGRQGVKEQRPGGDDAIRPPLPDAAPDHPAVEQHRRWIRLRRERPWLTTAPIEVVDRSNRTLDYRVGDLAVRLDVDHGVRLDGA